MTSRPTGRRGLEDDDDDFIPQAPERGGQELKKTPGGSPEFVPDIAARAKEDIQEIDMEAKKTAVQTSKVIAQNHEAVAIKEAVLFDEEEEEIEGRADGHMLAPNPSNLWVSNEDRNTAYGTFGGQADCSLGAPCPNVSEERRSRTRFLVPPGAFRVAGFDNEEGDEEDELTFTVEEESEEQAPIVTREQSIEAELVNTEEEERCFQERINQALESERQKAVVAEVAPVNDGDLSQSDSHRFGTRRRWFVIGAILLIVVAIMTTLALTLLPEFSEPSNCGKDGYFGPNCDLYYPNCSMSYLDYIGDGYCDGVYNTTECGWDGGDCIRCNDGYFGPYCDLDYPNCSVPDLAWIGDGVCNGELFNTEECGWDGGDCIRCNNDGYFGPYCNLDYPNCSVLDLAWIGDDYCNGEPFNTEECGWDGGDCIRCNNDGYFGPYCNLDYPNCSVPDLAWIGDGYCNDKPYNTEECGWDGGDCL